MYVSMEMPLDVTLIVRTDALDPDLSKVSWAVPVYVSDDFTVDEWMARELGELERAQSLGRAAIIHWQGVYDDKTSAPAPVTLEGIDCLMKMPGIATAFLDQCSEL
jgi:hypothetical protein